METKKRILTFIKQEHLLRLYSETSDIEGALKAVGYYEEEYIKRIKYIESGDEDSKGIGYVIISPYLFIYTVYLEDIDSKEYNIIPFHLKRLYLMCVFNCYLTQEETQYIINSVNFDCTKYATSDKIKRIIRNKTINKK